MVKCFCYFSFNFYDNIFSGMYTGMKQHAMNVSIDTEIAGGAFWHLIIIPMTQ